MNRRQFFTMWVNDEPGGSADAPDEYYYDDSFNVDTVKVLPFTLTLDNNIFQDVIGNNLSKILVSLRMKELFDRFKGSAPPYRWLEANIQSQNKKVNFKYYLMIFLKKPDVLDFEKTRFIGDDYDYIYPFFSYNKIKDFPFFPEPIDSAHTMVVSLEVKDQILRQNISCIRFKNADVVFEDS